MLSMGVHVVGLQGVSIALLSLGHRTRAPHSPLWMLLCSLSPWIGHLQGSAWCWMAPLLLCSIYSEKTLNSTEVCGVSSSVDEVLVFSCSRTSKNKGLGFWGGQQHAFWPLQLPRSSRFDAPMLVVFGCAQLAGWFWLVAWAGTSYLTLRYREPLFLVGTTDNSDFVCTYQVSFGGVPGALASCCFQDFQSINGRDW